MSDHHQSALLVTGAGGHLGRQVIELLREAGAQSIIATTRTPEKLADLSAQGVTVRYADFDDPTSLPSAFAGAERLLLISTGDAGQGLRRLIQHVNAVKAAEEADVKHILYTSLINPGDDSPVKLAPDHRGTEAAIALSSMGWTFLRNNVYAETLVGTLAYAAQTGTLFGAGGGGRTGYVTREDCARAAAAALLDSFDGRRVLDITGPEALSQADLAHIASTITGQPITYVPVELEVLVQNMTNAGLPRPLAEFYASFDSAIAQGKLDVVSDAFETLTGRKPTRIVDFLAAQLGANVSAAP